MSNKLFSVLSWNVEHFKGKPERIKRIFKTIHTEAPDVIGIYEVEGKTVFNQMMTNLKDYTFHITEGRQTQEICVGVRKKFTAFFTQRTEFKRNNPSLRPGALLTLALEEGPVSILFLHLKSLTNPEGFGLRDAMFDKVFSLKRALDKQAKKRFNRDANFIFLGDLNTMGMDYRGKKHDISGMEEIAVLTKKVGGRRRMSVIPKTAANTWNNGSKSKYPPSNLDHVVAANHIQFANSRIVVKGWPEEPTVNKKDKWIEKFSDHAYLTFSVTGI